MVGFLRLCRHFAARKKKLLELEEVVKDGECKESADHKAQEASEEVIDLEEVTIVEVNKDGKDGCEGKATDNMVCTEEKVALTHLNTSKTVKTSPDVQEVVIMSSGRARKRNRKVTEDKCVQAAVAELSPFENDNQSSSKNKKTEKEILRGFDDLGNVIDRGVRLMNEETDDVNGEFVEAIEDMIEKADAVEVYEVIPKSALRLDLDPVIVEEVIDVVTVSSPAPDIGQTEHENLFLRNYFNPPESSGFPFKEGEERKNSETSDSDSDDSDDDSVVCLSPSPAVLTDASTNTTSPSSSDVVVAVNNYETNLASTFSAMTLITAADDDRCNPPDDEMYFTAPKIKYHNGANDNIDGDDDSNVVVVCGESRLDRNRRNRKRIKKRKVKMAKKQQQQKKKAAKKCSSSTNKRKKCKKCQIKRIRKREAQHLDEVDLPPPLPPHDHWSRMVEKRQLRVNLIDIATDVRFFDVLSNRSDIHHFLPYFHVLFNFSLPHSPLLTRND